MNTSVLVVEKDPEFMYNIHLQWVIYMLMHLYKCKNKYKHKTKITNFETD